MIDPFREIRPEDFVFDTDRVFWTDRPEGLEAKRKYEAELAELKRLYQIQEENKARAKFKAEQFRKSQIPYSEHLAMEICKCISEGQFMINIVKDVDMPILRNVNQWLKDHSDFKALYDQAINDRLNSFEDQVITIPDEAGTDYEEIKVKGVTRKILDPVKIAGAKLRVDARKAHLKAYRPAIWGEQSTLNVNNNTNDMDNMTQEEIEAKIAELEEKDNVTRYVA